MILTAIKAWLLNPAILLALVPLVKFVIEGLFRSVFKNSTLQSLDRAAANENTVIAVKDAVSNKNVREALATYVDNTAALERFFETCFFAAFSLGTWWVTEQNRQTYQEAINIILLLAVIIALVVVGILVLQRGYESGRRKAAQNPARFAYGINLLILLLESAAIITGQ